MSRIAFFGTPDFAVPSLEALVEAGYAPVRVLTQPARPVGRGRRLREPPVAQRAVELGLEVRQPERVREEDFLVELEALDLDLAVVVAFGQIFPQRLLDAPRRGCVNLHASLLPRHRGASPIQASVLAGDSWTGVSIMRMEAGLDSGPVYSRARLAIGPDETAGELATRLADLGAERLVEELPRLLAGEAKTELQDESIVTFAPLIRKGDGRVDWREPSVTLERRLRAYTPWPGLSTELRGERIRLHAVVPRGEGLAGEPGSVLAIGSEGIRVSCGSGDALTLTRLQRAGRCEVSARDFANGLRLQVGETFG